MRSHPRRGDRILRPLKFLAKPRRMVACHHEHYDGTGYPGGLKETSMAETLERHPQRVLHEAVRRMLPKNTLARHMLSKLKLYAGPEHPHQAQKPEPLPV